MIMKDSDNMMNKKVLVIGSLNMDFSISVDKLPVLGETVLGNSFILVPGGKGANQAYALGKLGANVSMIGAVGNDEYGIKLIENLKSVNVDVSGVKVIDGESTGCAFVNVDSNGDNNIIAIGGANLKVSKDLIDENINKLNEADYVVMQLEIPIDTIKYVIDIAKKLNKTIIIDPAPAKKGIDEIFDGIDIIKPNITELELLTDSKIKNNSEVVVAAKKLLNLGVKNVIVTLGENGSILINSDKNKHFKTFEVETVDSTAAGDSFIGGLVKALAEGKPLENSIKYGHIVSSYAVTKKGAQSSIPTEDELKCFIKDVKKKVKERIIIDADPGVDDAFALMLAVNSNKFKIEGITTVAGNCDLKNATNNTFKILDLCKNNDFKVYKGMDKSLSDGSIDAAHVHGNNGLGGIIFEKSKRKPENIDGVDYLIEAVNNNPREITLIALGPLTNIAEAINRNENFANNIKKLVIMGGGDNLGNITPYAEFNFYKDPVAAKIVFEKLKCEIVVVPLNVTHKFPLTYELEENLKNMNNEVATFLYDITRQGAKFDREQLHLAGLIINDPITIIYLLDNSSLKLKKVNIDIVVNGERSGMSNIEENINSNISFAYDIDSEKCYKILFKNILDIEV